MYAYTAYKLRTKIMLSFFYTMRQAFIIPERRFTETFGEIY
ncbi:hypothetical protein BACEGG_03345 [Bacteroides eggerthii DSM 20697]|nr:hypothetical protein BACEGG_03345 [Bacteroides eggerthii DSM 20697]